MDLDVVWAIVTTDRPGLVQNLQEVLNPGQ